MRIALGVFAFAFGCSSSSFEVSQAVDLDTGTLGSDTGTTVEDTRTTVSDGTTVSDTGSVDSGVVVTDGTVVESSVGCPILTEVTEVWVDATSTVMMPTGAPSCPFRHLAEAVTFVNSLPPKARTIRLRAGTYNESVAIMLRPQVTLRGAGVETTTIAGGGPCMGIGSCIVRVDGGATLDGVTVDAGPTAKHGIVTGNTDPGGYPIIKNVKVTGAVGDGNAGILSSSGSLIGPNVDVTGNRFGLVIWGNQKVSITGGNNHFDKNTEIGINHEATGPLVFDGGGTVTGNGGDGVRVGGTATPTPPNHTLNGITITDNIGAGVRIMANAGATLRGNRIVGNKWGVVAIFGSTNVIDLGTASSAGNNNFGGGTVRNEKAALCAGGTRTTPMAAVTNRWVTCPTQTKSLGDISTTASCESITSYSDIWWRGVAAPDAASCSFGS